MPTVIFVRGFRFYFFSNENNEPIHIHVEKGGSAAKWWMEPMQENYSYGFSPKERKQIGRIITEHQNVIKNGMNTSDKQATDPLDRLVHESDVKAKHVVIDRELNLILVVLKSGGILRVRISDFPKLKKASETKLNDWRLISNGSGIHWKQLDEDLSVKGMVRQAALDAAIREVTGNSAVQRKVA